MQPTHLGPYRIERKLGEGGMDEVYLGTDENQHRQVAIKLLPREMASRPGFRLRFEGEIESLRKLEHPHIVKLFGFGEQQGQLFYAMEYVPGNSLQDELTNKRKFSWSEMIELGIPLCEALRHAHLHGIIHRDIKPANIMLGPNGKPKLTDFGIARLYGFEGFTMAGGPIGTASYMAPEQARGDVKITEHADLYALGGTFYALLAGHPPFVADSLLQLIDMHKNKTAQPVDLLVPDVPQELSIVISTLLRKNPHDRVANAGMLAKSLKGVRDAVAFRQGQSPTPPAASTAKPTVDPALISPTQAAIAAATPETPEPTPGVTPGLTPGFIPKKPLGNIRSNQPSRPYDVTTVQLASEDPDVTLASTPGGDPDQTMISTAARAATLPSMPATDQPPNSPAETSHATSDHTVFITAEEAHEQDRQRAQDEARRRPRIISTPTVIFLLLLIATAGGLLLWHQPLDPNKQFKRIVYLSQKTDDNSMEQAQLAILRFEELVRSDDPRLNEITQIKEDLQVRDLEKKLRRRSKLRMANAQSLSPIERICLEAITQMQSQPERALAQLQALQVLYADPQAELSRREQRLLDVAKRLTTRLQETLESYKTTHLAPLRQQLVRARHFLKINPTRTLAVCQSILTLYGDKAWAQQIVTEAKQLQQQTINAMKPPPAP